jgi:uncharacterized protein YlxW (UPF0749 family)
LAERQARLEVEQRTLTAERDRLLSGSAEQRLAAARDRASALAILAGTVPAIGPGVRITITDPGGVVDSTLVLGAIQELRDAGAEAMSLGPVRIVGSTWFDNPPTGLGLVVSGTTLSSPYQLLAIGDTDTLTTALKIPGGVSDSIRAAGAHITISPERTVLITALHPATPPQYASPAPQS